MKNLKELLPRAIFLLLIFTIICGILYTLLITGFAELFFKDKANGSIIEVDGKKYGSYLLAQPFEKENHMFGRIMNIDTKTFKDENEKPLLYAIPSNKSPASDEYKELIEERVSKIKAQNPDMDTAKVPVDLVTCSGSGLDPHISLNAANYQVPRLATKNNKTQEEIKEIIEKCTTKKLLGFIGEDTVNVLEVNLMLDGILK
ncbi:MAG: potassium-transporting ATPase subunit C [Clostridia bacterium]